MSPRPYRRRAPLWAAASLALCAPLASAVPPGELPAHPAGADVAAALGLTAATVVTLDIDPQPNRLIQVPLTVEGQQILLDLHPHSVRAPGFTLREQLADGSWRDVDPGPVNTVRGVIAGMEGSVAAGGVLDDGLYLTFIFPEGRQFWLEPIAGRVPGAVKGHYALYRNGDGLGGGFCGTTDLHRHPGPGDPPGEEHVPSDLRGGTLYTAELATDADFEYYARWGGTTQVNARIATIINTVNLQYERDVNITHVISATRVRTAEPDPYSSTNPNTLLNQFTNHWESNEGSVTRDIAHLFTGKDLDGGTIGIAWVGRVCVNTDYAYGLSQSDWSSAFMMATDLTAHELGHNWNGNHCSCSNPNSTMNPFITGVNRFGVDPDDTADTDIPAYRNTRPCLTTATIGFAPPNDDCTESVLIGEGTFGFNNFNATTDGPTACGSIGADIWYHYVPACDGTLTVSTCIPSYEPATFDTVLAAYTGTCSTLTQIACNDDSASCSSTLPGFRQSFISFAVARGTTYRIRVGGFSGASGNGLLNVIFTGCPPPSNNFCASATTIVQNVDYPFSTIGATTDGPLEPSACNFFSYSQVGSDVWFRYVAPCAGTVRVSTCGSGYDTKLAVYTSCPGAGPSAIACNDDAGPACTGTRSSLDFAAAAGVAYYIRVGGYNNAQGVGTIRVESLSCPAASNDLCANAAAISLGSTPFSTIGAVTDGPAEPGACNQFNDVWFRFTATCTGRFRAITCGADYDSEIAVYAAPCSDTASAIACNDDACGLQSQVNFPGVSGQQYLIRVGGFNASHRGSGTLLIRVAADWTSDGLLNSADISAYLTDWLASVNGGTRVADFDNSNAVNSADVSAFLTAWLEAVNNGCP